MQTARSLRFGLIGGLAAITSALASAAQAQYVPVPEPRVLQAPPSGPPVAEPAPQGPAAVEPGRPALQSAPPATVATEGAVPSQNYAPVPALQTLATPGLVAPAPVYAAPPPPTAVTDAPAPAPQAFAPPPPSTAPPAQAYAPPEVVATSQPPASTPSLDAPLRTAPQGGWEAPGALAAPVRPPAVPPRAAIAIPSFATPRTVAAPPTPRQLELLRRYLALINFYRTMDESMSNLGSAMVASFGKDLPVATQNAVLQATGESVRVNYPKMMAETEVAMAGVLSLEELEAAVAFYESPVGRSITSKMGELTPIVAAQTRRWLPIFQADIEQRVCARMACAPTAGRAPPGG